MIAGTISGSDVATLCETLVRMLEDDNAGPVVCDVGAMCRADLAAVDGLARIQLAAGSRGRRIRLRAPSAELRELIALVGLGDVLP